MEKLKEEIIKILESNSIKAKIGSDGEYEGITCVDNESFGSVSAEICSLIQSVTDPENQPNQYGITL